MRKLSLACALVLMATSAQAQTFGLPGIVPYNTRMEIIPPPEYDKPYDGTLTIYRVSNAEELYFRCGMRPKVPLACGVRRALSKTCDIFIVTDDILAAAKWPYDVILRHEQGHCGGWPADHTGALSEGTARNVKR